MSWIRITTKAGAVVYDGPLGADGRIPVDLQTGVTYDFQQRPQEGPGGHGPGGRTNGREPSAGSMWLPSGPDAGTMVLSVDPGKETGMAWCMVPVVRLGSEVFGACELPCWEAVDAVAELLADRPRLEVVCESYNVNQTTHKKTRQYWSLESIGALRWLCRTHDVKFHTQRPMERKFGEDKLKPMGWHRSSRDGHMVSAAAHLLTYVANTNRVDADVLGRLV